MLLFELCFVNNCYLRNNWSTYSLDCNSTWVGIEPWTTTRIPRFSYLAVKSTVVLGCGNPGEVLYENVSMEAIEAHLDSTAIAIRGMEASSPG